MTVTAAFVERAPESSKLDLAMVFKLYRQKYGDGDLGLMLTGMHIEALEKIAALETRLERLEQKKR
jgi:hypothetical protein